MSGGNNIGGLLRLTYHGVVCSKKNNKRIIVNRRTGRPTLISSKNAKANEQDMILQFKTQRPRNPIPSPVKVRIAFWEPNRLRRDLDNQTTSVMDALVRAGVIEDDSTNHVVEIQMTLMGFDRDNPRAVVLVQHTKGPK